MLESQAVDFGPDVIDIDGFTMIATIIATKTLDYAIAGSHASSTEQPQPLPEFSS
jgi:hypothetical protein